MSQEKKVPILRSANSLIDQEFDSIRDRFEEEMRRMEQEMAKFRSQMISSMSSRGQQTSSRLTSTSTTTKRTTKSSDAANSLHDTMGLNENDLPAAAAVKQGKPLLAKPATEKETVIGQQQTTSSDDQRAARPGGELVGDILNSESCQQIGASETNVGAGEQQQFDAAQNSAWLEDFVATSPLVVRDSETGNKWLKLRYDVSAYEPEQIVVKTVDNRLQIHAKHEERSANKNYSSELNREFLLPEGTDPELIRSSLSADGVLTIEAPL